MYKQVKEALMQDIEKLKDNQEYKLTSLMIKGVARMVASNCTNSGYEIYLEEETRNSMTTTLKVFTGKGAQDYVRLCIFHFHSTNTVDFMWTHYVKGKRKQIKDAESVDVNNLYNLLMQAINEVIPCQQT